MCSSFSKKKHSNNDDEMRKMNDIEYTKQIVIDSTILDIDSNSNDTGHTVLMNSENVKGHANASNDRNR